MRLGFFGLFRFAFREMRVNAKKKLGRLLFFLFSFILVVICDGGRGFALQAVIAPRCRAYIEDEAANETKKERDARNKKHEQRVRVGVGVGVGVGVEVGVGIGLVGVGVGVGL